MVSATMYLAIPKEIYQVHELLLADDTDKARRVPAGVVTSPGGRDCYITTTDCITALLEGLKWLRGLLQKAVPMMVGCKCE